jgi:ubiquinone/menaquinone biosynthesis C-methylase UbiE
MGDMKKTDYSKIAERYDKNPHRQYSEIDKILEDYLKQTAQQEYDILDLACGTGDYLAFHVQAFRDYNIHWYGLDATEEMLQIAKQKVKGVEFSEGYAESLPYEAERFDFIINNYAFHHFENKSRALDEIKRVLKKRGIFRIRNISPQHMPKWNIYQYFPHAVTEDQKRFWNNARIYDELEKRGFEVKIKVDYRLERIQLTEVLAEVVNRDISQLNIISDQHYERGVKRIREDLKKNANAWIIHEGASLSCIAEKIR